MSYQNSPAQQQGGWHHHHHHHHHHHPHHQQHHHYQMHQPHHQHHHHHHHHHAHHGHHHHHHHAHHQHIQGHHHHHHHHHHQPSPPEQNNQPPPSQLPEAAPMNQFGFSIPTPSSASASQQQDDPLRPYFDSIVSRNPDNNGLIGPHDLAEALSEGTYKFSASVAEKLVKMFDRTNNNALDFNEYKAAHDFINKMSAGFKARDVDGSGVLETGEVREALEASGYKLSEPCLQLLMKKFSDKSLGGVRFDLYTSLSILLARSTQVYSYYDRNRSGLVTFNFDSFFAALMSAI